MQYVFGILMSLTALFLILLVLVQRGRGGGLAGAFGGMGGQSAFGTKAGDTFTKITIGASVFWLLLCVFAVRFLGSTGGAFGRMGPPAQTQLAPRGLNELPALPGGDETTSDAAGVDPATTDAGDPTASDGAEVSSESELAEPGAEDASGQTSSEPAP